MAIVHLTKDVDGKNDESYTIQDTLKFKNDDKRLRGALVPLDANTNAKQLPKSAKKNATNILPSTVMLSGP